MSEIIPVGQQMPAKQKRRRRGAGEAALTHQRVGQEIEKPVQKQEEEVQSLGLDRLKEVFEEARTSDTVKLLATASNLGFKQGLLEQIQQGRSAVVNGLVEGALDIRLDDNQLRSAWGNVSLNAPIADAGDVFDPWGAPCTSAD